MEQHTRECLNRRYCMYHYADQDTCKCVCHRYDNPGEEVNTNVENYMDADISNPPEEVTWMPI